MHITSLTCFDFTQQNKGPVVKLSSTQVNKDLMGEATLRKKRPAQVLKVADQFLTTPSGGVEVVSKALLGRKVCILSEDEDCKKSELRSIVEWHSGTFVSNIGRYVE